MVVDAWFYSLLSKLIFHVSFLTPPISNLMPLLSSATVSVMVNPIPEIRAGAAVTAAFVVGSTGKPLMPTTPKRARRLLKAKRADVFCKNPFTIRLLDREDGDLQPLELKADPGAKKTGMVVAVKGTVRGWFCIAAWELQHRGQAIRDALLSRSQLRRGRRNRKTRYRPARFNNRTRSKKKGWLPPSLRSRVDNVIALGRKIQRVAPLTGIAVERVRFDTQLMQNPEVSGVGYQQGTLAGYEVREYLLEKWHRTCVYCKAQNAPLQIEHLTPKSRGGSDRVSNLALACEKCNQKKANRPLEDFLKGKPELLNALLRQAKAPLKDAAAVNSTRNAIVTALQALGLPVTTGTGGRTKFNRCQQGYAKAHWIDAACVGQTGEAINLSRITHATTIQAKGRGRRQMCSPNKFGFPRTAAKSVKRIHGFQSGDRARLVQPSGKYQGTHEGTVAIRANGEFDIKTIQGLKISAPHTRFTLIQRFDGTIQSHRQAS